MKVKLFSHTDLDGYGCNIVARSVFNNNVDCENLNYNNVNDRIKEFINSEEHKDYDRIYITDISVNDEVAKILDNSVDTYIKLLDHHPTALELNSYEWVIVDIERDGEKTCGTRMLYDELINKQEIDTPYKKSLLNIVENIRKYDTWLWKEKYGDVRPKQLNDIFFILGEERFCNMVLDELNYCNCENTIEAILGSYSLLLELQQEKIDKYINKKNKEIIEYILNGYNIGIVFAEQFQSELGNRLSELNPQYDLIVMIGDKTISYRTIHENINCGNIASWFGGGGHPKASGSQISLDNKYKYIDELFKFNS